MSNPFENLAQGIVLQAVSDWRASVKKLKKEPEHKPSLWRKEECERFFRSGWFEALTGVDGSVILRKLEAELK